MGQQSSSANDDSVANADAATYSISPASWRIRDMPERIRPREEVQRVGVENVADDVLIALLLRTGVQGMNVVDLSRDLMRRYGSLTSLSAASVEELSQVRGISRTKAQILRAALEIGKRLNAESLPKRIKIRTPEDVLQILEDRCQGAQQETFWTLMLDAKNTLKSNPVDVSVGLLDASLVHPREVFGEAIRTSAAAVVLAHNHPSGDPTPSSEDLRITKQLVAAGKIVDITVLDHVIIGKRNTTGCTAFMSMRESGLIEFG
jgi:DNA repair protein RadC